jgi:predicted DNA binding CopG/RHH family protein
MAEMISGMQITASSSRRWHVHDHSPWAVQPETLTEFHFLRRDFHMKTTLSISDATMRAVKREAARRGQTISELVESALRQTLCQSKPAGKLPPMPPFSSGGGRVDVSDRNSLYDAMGR